jgi:ABC-type transport system involved in multi-copper enzyme maturation permease subunit
MYVGLTTFASLALVVPSAIVLRRIAQRSEVGLWSFLGNILRRGKEARGRKSRTVWANPVAWREAATRAGFSGRGLTRWLTIIIGLAGAVTVVVFYHRWLNDSDTAVSSMALQNTRLLLLGLIIVEFSVSLLVATNTSAAAVTKERESQTLDLLLVTPITSRYYIWGKLRGLVSFMLPFAAVPTVTILLVVLYDAFMMLAGRGQEKWVVWPETLLTMPLLLTVMLAWSCMLGLQLSLKWSRTIVAVMASVGVLAGICSVLGVCGFTAAAHFNAIGPVIASFSPFTAICMLIDPEQYARSAFTGPNGMFSPDNSTGAEMWVGRVLIVVSIVVASGTYCAIIWGMYRSMVKNFDMIIRRQHQ